MQVTKNYIVAQAYAQGRIDAGEPAFMDPDGFASNATVGAFAYHYSHAVEGGQDIALITAWATFMEQGGRTVIITGDTDTHEDEMATVAEAQALHEALGTCGMSRTFVGGPTVRCTLRLGHSSKAKHTYTTSDNVVLTWTTEESDQILADRVHYVPASTYSTEVTTTGYPVSTDAQVAADMSQSPVKQEA